VFNKDAVREWSVRKEPLTLILCDADEFEKRKRELIGIGEREAKKRYDRRLEEIERKYKEESKEYYEKIAEIENELAEAKKRMKEYADVFARIDESEIDTLAQQAVDLFYAGEVDRAIELFEQGRYMEKIIEKRKRIKEREEVIAQLKENNIVDRETLEKNAETIMELAGMYKSSMELKEALKMYNDAMNIYERLSIADTLKYKESIDHIKVELESLEKNEKELQ
jgi:tetratricopeptide (TPR) repeat protein